jgi:serine-type D-Ala-D-Ala carboxypeptidase/endopeptidase
VRTRIFALLFVVCGAAGAAPTLPDAYRQVLEQGIKAGAYRDVAAGWIEGKERDAIYFGQATAETTFEIGAATEIFTDLLLAQAAFEGKLRLQTQLREVMPDFAFADPALGSTTLEALATHHAGFSAMPPNLMPRDIGDPYAGYGEAEILAFLGNHHLPRSGNEYAYSVTDAGVLGYALGRGYGTEYPKLLQDKVLGPLALKHTGFDDSGLLAGHARGEPVPHWHFGVLSGSAGLRTTLGDLLDFLQVNLRPENSTLRAALLVARQPRTRAQSEQVGLGWHIHEAGSGDQTWPLLWRASTTAGFSTFIGFRTDRQQAVALLGNTDTDLSAIGMALLEDHSAPPTPRARFATPAHLQADDFVGLYQVRGSIEITIRQRDGQLSAQLSGGPIARLTAEEDDVFDAGAEGFAITFQREAGKVTSLIVTRAGVNVLAERLSTRAPHVTRTSIAIDAKELAAYAGDYQLGEAGLARIFVATDKLSMQLAGRAPVDLIAFAKDRFACADEACEATFQRNVAGVITDVSLDFAGTQHNAPRVRWTK